MGQSGTDLERSVRLGLVALAVSDAAFCFFYLLATFLLPTRAKYAPDENRTTLYFGIYHEVRTKNCSNFSGLEHKNLE